MMNRVDYIREGVERLAPWYHKIDLGSGILTPGYDFEPVWDSIRRSRSLIDYRGKSVLDIASWGGMWAFEAEARGASMVVAVETAFKKQENFLFCREVLRSRAIPFYNVSAYNLAERLDVCFTPFGGSNRTAFEGFDIVQHLGLLYHLSDPIASLMQTRSVMKDGGLLLIETAYHVSDKPTMLFQGVRRKEGRIYAEDHTTWWAPSLQCLTEMLATALFEPVPDSLSTAPMGEISMVSLVCRALPLDDQSRMRLLHDLGRTWRYRGPGHLPLGQI
jgi:SAM-dependent methyltransferase